MTHFSLKTLLSLSLSATLLLSSASALTTEQAKLLLEQYYVEDLPESVLEADTLEEVIANLHDPYTVYMTAEEFESFSSQLTGQTLSGGIGVMLAGNTEAGAQVLYLVPDGPAAQAGLQPGDLVISVDGQTITTDTDTAGLLVGEAGSTITLTVQKQGEETTQVVTMTRSAIHFPTVTYYSLGGGTGYLLCSTFGTTTAQDMETALLALEDQSDVWILDLQDNGGGYLDEAVDMVGLFTEYAPVTYSLDYTGDYTPDSPKQSIQDLTDAPVIVLTNRATASASEMFASAIRDANAGISIGQRTYGKGVSQILLDENSYPDLFDGDCFKITSGRFYSPEGTSNHVIGVFPTLLISPSNTLSVAKLLHGTPPTDSTNFLMLELADQVFYLAIEEGMNSPSAFLELLQALPPSASLYLGQGGETWTPTAPDELAQELSLPFQSRSFSDIADSPYQHAIDSLASQLLLTGYEDGTFRPQQTISRAEFSAMLASAVQPFLSERNFFSDVAPDAWYAPYVNAMAAYGVFQGDDQGLFHPNDPISYEEVVTVLNALIASLTIDGAFWAEQPATEQDYATYAQYSTWAVTAARNLELFDCLIPVEQPQQAATREQVAALIFETLDSQHILWN